MYRNPDGSIRRELRPPEEVFKADSLATLRDAPLLEGHPSMVKPDNWRDYARGHVSGEVRADGEYVAGEVVVQDVDLLARIDSGAAGDRLSCGYTCREDHTPGTWRGQAYDLVQRNIVYNHVGVVPAGRAGSDVGLRFDCADIEEGAPQRIKMQIRFDGKEYEACSEEHLLAVTTKLDAVSAAAEKATKERETVQAKLDTEIEAHAKTKAELAAAQDPKRLDAAVADCVNLIVDAASVLGKTHKFDGKTTDEILKETILAVKPEAKLDGKSSDYLRARFDAIIESGERVDSISAVPGVLKGIGANGAENLEKARKDEADRKAKLDALNEPVWDAVKE